MKLVQFESNFGSYHKNNIYTVIRTLVCDIMV